MKPTLLLTSISLLIAILFFSCKDDESPSYSFKNQDLTGKIGNISWTYGDGYANTSDEWINIDLFLAQDETGCNVFIPEGDEVFFTLPNKVGLYKLNLDVSGSGSDNRVVTIFEADEFVNHLAATGAVEILSISETEVSGRIDAQGDEENFVNGNFTVSICPQ